MNWTIGSKLLAAALIVVLLLSGVAYLFQRNARLTATAFGGVMGDLLAIVELAGAVESASATLSQFGIMDAAEAVREYGRVREAVDRARGALPPAVVDPADVAVLGNLRRMAASFLEKADAAAAAHAGRDLVAYTALYREADTISDYIGETAQRLIANELTAYRSAYPGLAAALERSARFGQAFLIAVTVLAAALALGFARGITRSLQNLVAAARRIAAGDFRPIALTAPSHQEVRVLAQAMDGMLGDIRRHIEIERLLREAELRALQAQMDPHFLFNTLNMVAKTAMIEGADRTCDLIEHVSELLRYNLRNSDEPVTLADEVQHVRGYLVIQQARFRDRLAFDIQVDDGALALTVPPLTLQPLVENSVIHGLSALERGGRIAVAVRRNNGRVRVTVADDGVGMPAVSAAQPADGRTNGGGRRPVERPRRGHTTGLGLENVRRRLELFYGESGLLQITSEPGAGTTVTLNLPTGRMCRVPIAGGG